MHAHDQNLLLTKPIFFCIHTDTIANGVDFAVHDAMCSDANVTMLAERQNHGLDSIYFIMQETSFVCVCVCWGRGGGGGGGGGEIKRP